MEHLYTKNMLVRVALTLLAMSCFHWAYAENITAEQALQLAQTFVSGQNNVPGGRHNSPGMTPQLTQEKQVSGLYVFNVADNGGFVIVSSDDRTAPILGFGESGHIDPDNMPSNMRAWLQGYADQIAWLQKQEAQGLLVKQNGQRKAPRRVGTHSTEAIEPLVTCHWNQRDPYNNQCPDYSEGKKAVTGCVATAMAQVMYYHKWPQNATTAIPTYTTGSYQINMPELPATTFDWANMIDVYEDPYTDDQATAVATLMLYCGQSVKMDYGPSSGASSPRVAKALKNNFDYNQATTKCVSRSYYSAAKWADMLYYELQNARPIIYSGQSSGGGHEFVCDGYKYVNDMDYFHINWGWGGTSDEYYLLSTLNPYDQGIGGSSTRDGFHYGQDAIIGIQKATDSGTTADITPNVVDLTLNSITLSKNKIYLGMTEDVTLNITNNSGVDYEGDVFLGTKSGSSTSLLNGDNCFIPAGETRDFILPFSPTEAGTFDVVLFLPTSDGYYDIKGDVAATVTVVDAVQNEIVPIYGYWADSYSRSQFIIPAEQMEALTTTDLPISLDGVTFYSSNQSVSLGDAEFDVYLAEVDETTFADENLKDWDSLNKVYSGSLSISNSKMVITFDNPYTYRGGNLLVGINQTTSGTNNECVWLGTTANGASLGGYGTTISQQNFIPATIFDFSDGPAPSVKRPTEVTVAYTGGLTATVNWMSEETAFDIEVNGIVTEDVTSPYVMSELEPATLYEIRVRAKNSEEYSLWTKPVSFTTQAETDAPFFLETTEVTANTATLNWNSIQDSYNVRYRTADDRKEIFFTPFNSDKDRRGWTYRYSFSGGEDPIFECDESDNSYLEMGYEIREESYIISPELPDYPSGSVVEFYHFYYRKSNTFQVGYSTTTNDLNAFTWSDPITAGSYYEKYSQVLPDGTKYVAFKATASDNDYTIFIDDFGIYNDISAGDWVQVNNVVSPLPIDGLESDTKYEWQVQGIYNSEPTEWSESATFTTLALSASPFGLEATEVTAHTATLNWTGIQDSYNARYRTAEDRVTPYFTSFNENEDRSGWTGSTIIFGGMDDPVYGYPGDINHMLQMGYNTRDEAYLISPELPDYPSGCVLKFNYFSGGSPSTFQVGYSTTTKDLSAFTWGSSIPAENWGYDTMYNEVLAEGIKYVAFKTTAPDDDHIIFIDNFGLFVKDIPAGDWTEVYDVASPLAIDGLTPGIRYEWQVQGFNYSDYTSTEWSQAFFTTNAYLELANDDSSADAEGKNSAIIAANAGMVADVKLTDRVFYKDTKWNTVCLPFDADLTDPECPFYGAIAKTLTDADLEGTHVTLTFGDDVTMLQAGIPYIIRWETGSDISDVVFSGVTIVSGSAADRTISLAGGQVNFIGYYDAFDIDTPDNDDIYYMTANNQLKHTGNKRTLKSCRAYFQFSENVLNSTRGFVLDFGDKDDVTTGIGEVTDSCVPSVASDQRSSASLFTHHSSLSEWHSLDGRKLDKKPTAKGVYLRNGRKVVMK